MTQVSKKIYLFLIFIFYFGLFLTLFSFQRQIVVMSIFIATFSLIKWIFNKRNCTFGYIECKLRRCERKDGYINQLCNFYGNLIDEDYVDILFLISFVIIIIQFIKLVFISKINFCKKGPYPS